jgi:site-specific DNA recombinase
LSDFAKIVDVFDAKGVSFVSVTQQFNTTTSMGRLTLNMLLSFAQFEREVTGERIRDKIAASKQKGMWMGGVVPLGYDVADRKLIVNAAEANTVRHIFRRYAALQSIHTVKEELEADSITSKARINRFGHQSGGMVIARGALYRMLQNRLYRGEIVHKGKCYAGQHEAIINEALWDEVQNALTGNRVERISGSTAASPSLLAGFVYDENGDRMSPTHANKKGTRYRYYVSQSLIKGTRTKAPGSACRIPAADLETVIEDRICALLCNEAALFDTGVGGSANVAVSRDLIKHAAAMARRWPSLGTANKRILLQVLVARIDVRPETIDIIIRPTMLRVVTDPHADLAKLATSNMADVPTQSLLVPAMVRRAGMEMKLLIQGTTGTRLREPDRSLLRLIGQARRFNDMFMTSRGKSMKDLSKEAHVSPSYFTRVLRLSFLSPEITKSILQGRHPAGLSAKSLLDYNDLEREWSSQSTQLGLA